MLDSGEHKLLLAGNAKESSATFMNRPQYQYCRDLYQQRLVVVVFAIVCSLSFEIVYVVIHVMCCVCDLRS